MITGETITAFVIGMLLMLLLITTAEKFIVDGELYIIEDEDKDTYRFEVDDVNKYKNKEIIYIRVRREKKE